MKFSKNSIVYSEKKKLLGNLDITAEKIDTFCGHDVRDALSATKPLIKFSRNWERTPLQERL
jgi:hypothetical protein